MAHKGFKVIDSDMHLIEPCDLWQTYMDDKYKEFAPVGVNNTAWNQDPRVHPRLFGVVTSGKVPIMHPDAKFDWSGALIAHMKEADPEYAVALERGWDGVSQLYAMDKEGIDVAVLFPSRGLFVLGVESSETAGSKGLAPEVANAIARAYNDWLHDFTAPDRKRLYGAAMVAAHDVKAAVAETRRCVEKFGFKSIFLLPGQINKRPWHDPHYYPLWQICEDLGIPVVFHGGGPDSLTQFGQGLYDKLMMWHTFSHSLGPMAAAVSFCQGGVFQRFPRLRAGFLEGNCSWAPWMLSRMDDQYEDYVGRFEQKLDRLPSEYFKSNAYISVEADEKPTGLVVQWMGDDNIVFSTDYPHPDSKFPHAVEKFMTLPLSDQNRRKLLWDNCARLYHIEYEATASCAVNTSATIAS